MAETTQTGGLDPIHYLGFLPGAHEEVNLMKQKFYSKLVNKGLGYMYKHHYTVDPDSPILRTTEENFSSDDEVQKTKKPKHIVVVGAGMSGLSAAYELKRAGHKVTILERQEQVGGRVKTLHFKFDPKGLLGEAGAMRIPLKNRHYLTDAYVKKFNLQTTAFYNIDTDKNCFVKVRQKTVRKEDFISEKPEARARAKKMCDTLWPNWDARIKQVEKDLKVDLKIYHIMEYYKRTIEEVVDTAPQKRKEGESVKEYTERWVKWMERWSKMSFLQFLTSNMGSTDDARAVLRPWPKVAIDGICDINYITNTSYSVATVLAEEIGKWWTPEMYTLLEGMEKLPEAFVQPDEPVGLENDLRFGITVRKVDWKRESDCSDCGNSYPVRIYGRQTRTGNEEHFDADAVIMTLPLNIMRQVEFCPFFDEPVNDAISGIDYQPATKIFLGFRERFWEKTKFPVKNGGVSHTNLPIGQIVYPRNIDHHKRGVLLLYTWEKDALLFGAQSEDEAITEALREVQLVYEDLFKNGEHPCKVTDYFEAGAIEAWYTDSSAQGAYVQLKPYSYMHHLKILLKTEKNRPVYLAGEAISFANGWIQGALESGLRAAWQFYQANESEDSE